MLTALPYIAAALLVYALVVTFQWLEASEEAEQARRKAAADRDLIDAYETARETANTYIGGLQSLSEARAGLVETQREKIRQLERTATARDELLDEYRKLVDIRSE